MLSEIISDCPQNLTIQDAIGKCYQVVGEHTKNLVAISGGRDSDIMADLIIRCGGKEKSIFAFFDTGFEYTATKKHLKYLEEKYRIKIEIVPPIKPIPLCVRKYGVPFWSKYVSDMISRLQRHGFKWEDEPLDELLEKYPKCKSALRWWCNDWGEIGRPSKFDIAYVRGLKEFMIANPPKFSISDKCCHYAKKQPAKKFADHLGADLNCNGVRRAEGGKRATTYKSCFTASWSGTDQYRPLFWFTDEDRSEYDQYFGIRHSDCYELWGMKRTGCAGCPFGRNYEQELELAKQYEPKFYGAMLKVFGESYEYRRQFEAFREALAIVST